jgi:hypothetical protein
MVTKELQLAGVTDWRTQRANTGHVQVFFDWAGRKRIVMLSGTGDWRGVKNTRSILRGILRGAR